MAETFIALLAAHLIGDFILQTDGMVARKRAPRVLLLHTLIVTALSALLLGSSPWLLLLILFLTHLSMDAVKIHVLPPGLVAFVLDQTVHLLIIIGLALFFPTAVANGFWAQWLSAAALLTYQQVLIIGIGLVVAVPFAGVVIGMLMAPFGGQLDEARGMSEGLPDGGRYIGWLERVLVMILYLSGQGAAIGFVIATKSIMRFGEIKDSRHRKLAEYILIGTFLSFAWVLACAALTMLALESL